VTGPSRHVICAVDRGAPGVAVRRQAEVLAAAGAMVEPLAAPPLTAEACGPFLDRCDGADLLAVSAAEDPGPLLEHATMPVLLARPGHVATTITDRILVAVDGSADPGDAAQVAGTLAARHRGEVAVVAAPRRDTAVERAIAATTRTVLDAAGVVPAVLGRRLSPEEAVAAAAGAHDATLVVLAVGTSDEAKARAARIARRVSCSVLALPRRGVSLGDGWMREPMDAAAVASDTYCA
jgi:hypothetical protein